MTDSPQSPLPASSSQKNPNPQVVQDSGTKTQPSISMKMDAFSGPLPPPQILEGYEKILKGSADRIIRMAENQASHRQAMETCIIKAEITDTKLGMTYAFIIMLLTVGCGTFLIYANHPVTGLTAIIGGVGAIVANFILGRRDESKSKSKEK